MNLTVLFEDNHLIGVVKPAGMLSQGDQTGARSLFDEVRDWIKVKYAKPGNVYLGLVHRLDRPVAGVMVFARTSKAAARLSEQFRERRVEKKYLALVEGENAPVSAELTSKLVWSETARKAIADERGKEATLTFRRLGSGHGFSLLEVVPLTGRKHQIRAQLAKAGFPIAGDRRYGAKRAFPEGIGLVCECLSFEHPTQKHKIELRDATLRERLEQLLW